MVAIDGAPLLRIREATVRKGEPGRAILDRLSLEIRQGEHTAILGPNGSGKSSLIKLITQEYRPLARIDDGPVVELFGRDRWDIFELRSLMGIVSPAVQDDLAGGAAGRNLEGLEMVVSGFFATRGVHAHQAPEAWMWERGRAALARVEAAHLAAKPMPEMSTGEARRVLIARALVADPPALLLDEPTAGLDMVASRAFLETLRGLARDGKTIVFVTHHLHEIIPEVERVVLLREGRVYLDGTRPSALSTHHLSAAFGAPVEVRDAGGGYVTMAMPDAADGVTSGR